MDRDAGGVAGVSGAREGLIEMGRFEQVAERLTAEMERWSIPGMELGVLVDGKVEAKGFGITSIETKQPVAANTLFQVGSISKVFTTTLVMRLVDEGLLDLARPVIEYVPELRLANVQAQRTITLRHLVTHTSGFQGDRFDDQGPGDDAITKAVAAFPTLRQQTAPGELWCYCNAGFDLAGRVVEKVLGQGFEAAMRERVWAPLGMERTTYFASEAITFSASVGHLKMPGETESRIARPWPIPRRSNPAGGISSTVEDLLKFAAFHLGDGTVNGERLLSKESLLAMRTVQAEAGAGQQWGLGWALRTLDGVQLASHGGGTNGFITQFVVIPEKGFAVASFTNSNHGGAANRGVVDQALEAYCGLKSPKPERITLSEAELAKFAGHYEALLSNLALTVKDGGLQVEATATNPFNSEAYTLPAVRLVPSSDRVFFVPDGEYEGTMADFIFNGDGSVRFVRYGGRLADRVSA